MSAGSGRRTLGTIIIVHGMVLIFVVAAAVVTLAIMAMMLTIVVASMVVLARRLVARAVTTLVAMASIALRVSVMVAMIAMMIAQLYDRTRCQSPSWSCILLELIKHAIRLISVLALLKKADEQDVIIQQSFMHLCILLLMLSWH